MDIFLLIVWFSGALATGIGTLVGMFLLSTMEFNPRLPDKLFTGFLGLLFLTCLYMSYMYITAF